jgi:hypothetical protein
MQKISCKLFRFLFLEHLPASQQALALHHLAVCYGGRTELGSTVIRSAISLAPCHLASSLLKSPWVVSPAC